MRLIFLLLLCSNVVFSQKTIDKQQLIWFNHFETIKFSKNWSFILDLQERRFINPGAQHQLVLRGHLQRELGESWSGIIGFCSFYQAPNEPDAPVFLVVPELRPHIEFGYKQKMKHLSIDHRYRSEARFFHETDAARTMLVNGYKFGNFRFRYRIQATVPIAKISQNCKLSLKLSDEIHINAGKNIVKNTFDQNRFSASLNVAVGNNWSFDAGWLNWFQMRPNVQYYDRSIFRFTTSHTLNLVKTAEK